MTYNWRSFDAKHLIWGPDGFDIAAHDDVIKWKHFPLCFIYSGFSNKTGRIDSPYVWHPVNGDALFTS